MLINFNKGELKSERDREYVIECHLYLGDRLCARLVVGGVGDERLQCLHLQRVLWSPNDSLREKALCQQAS